MEAAVLDAVMHFCESIDNGHVASLTAIGTSEALDSVERGFILQRSWAGRYGIEDHWLHDWQLYEVQQRAEST